MEQKEILAVLTEMRDEAKRAVQKMDASLAATHTISATVWRKAFNRRYTALDAAIFILSPGE